MTIAQEHEWDDPRLVGVLPAWLRAKALKVRMSLFDDATLRDVVDGKSERLPLDAEAHAIAARILMERRSK